MLYIANLGWVDSLKCLLQIGHTHVLRARGGTISQNTVRQCLGVWPGREQHREQHREKKLGWGDCSTEWIYTMKRLLKQDRMQHKYPTAFHLGNPHGWQALCPQVLGKWFLWILILEGTKCDNIRKKNNVKIQTEYLKNLYGNHS